MVWVTQLLPLWRPNPSPAGRDLSQAPPYFLQPRPELESGKMTATPLPWHIPPSSHNHGGALATPLLEPWIPTVSEQPFLQSPPSLHVLEQVTLSHTVSALLPLP